ncbi:MULTISPECIES: GNAT family N-acetyltransferase [Pseudonocardia]|uniref:N-acetyltransferase domain-containing protein n=2 Tax=Pseudonocardia TaxID=1847 RepID=A0A1Y2MT46_PSEAH|nr:MULTISPECIES: GNAT family N-acetyltransferase [Pseudonocardia]OSY38159.1 hypothetical protein BG845_04332 [Pseudonocardia autotrophica]TDN75599.1 RimJ/RimL family protein N-acetyltransferase [Pseudonocardia autotrophica]BBF99570.1 hypothetical protein Pdca_07800 [Pseudonocardia autotrophica]GEC27809.1 hypothetical protein PSA01_48380 [Pseudonocardia saturnea]
MDVRIDPLDERGLAELLDAAVRGADPGEVMPAGPGAVWDAALRSGFLAFHRSRSLGPAPVERTWVIRVDGRAAGAVRLQPGPDDTELGIWLARGARGRGAGTAAVRQLLATAAGPGSGVPLVARTTASNVAALGLLRALGADPEPGGEGAVTLPTATVDHVQRRGPGHGVGPTD